MANTNIDIKVTRIAKRWHARLILNGKIYDEMACACREDIGYICRTMLRWLDKTGGSTPFTSAARRRHTISPKGQIWYRPQKQ